MIVMSKLKSGHKLSTTRKTLQLRDEKNPETDHVGITIEAG